MSIINQSACIQQLWCLSAFSLLITDNTFDTCAAACISMYQVGITIIIP